MTQEKDTQSLPRSGTRWLITGGCGFIGTSLIRRLMAEGGHQIRVLDNLSVGTREDLAKICDFKETQSSVLSPQSSPQSGAPQSSLRSGALQLVVGDIRDDETCLACCSDIDVIVHLAANTGVFPSVQDPRKDMEANVIGTFNMLEAAREKGVKRFVFASSGAPVGECSPPIHEELACHPVSPYGASKLAGEGYCSAFFRTFGIETVALRFGNVYGPGSGHKSSVVAKFIRQAVEGEACEIYGDGTQTRDFIYIDDLVEAVSKAAGVQSDESGGTSQSSVLSPQSFSLFGEIFQIATSREHTVNEVAESLKNILKEEAGISMKIIHGDARLGDVKRNFSDTSKAKKYLGWSAETDLEDGLRKTVKWFVEKKDGEEQG